ncbi:aminodeoxychorismate synthase component I [Sphingomonas sp. PB2P19]|uniref:aminodeoxychorismate synthase component I n=1 Tax=Sphingomonas rhamnosi TaxID=3096156 RepID=UPI002FC6DB5B
MLTAPFVLLDDASAGGAPPRLYRDPVRIVRADMPAQVLPALEALRAACAEGLHAAGYLTYEAGEALAARPVGMAAVGPLLWFGLFRGYQSPADVAALLPNPAGARAGPPQPVLDAAEYDTAFARVSQLIAAGDIYQANLTFAATIPFVGDPFALYAGLRAQSCAGYGALIDTGEHRFLSLSPELFFALDGDTLTCRPMKGTAARGDTPDEDRALAAALAADPKQRAENLMIVDLMRNDMSRVARHVAVPDLFTVETYPTVHQMTSTITATLEDGRDSIDVIAALFPCGSITGAPKQRAMEVIAEVERARPRGLYTGAIGYLDPNGDAMFNVAIRTLTVDGATAVMGLGSGIVADSDAGEERRECLAKAAFVTAGQRAIDLIETMAFDPEAGIPLLERHLARMKASADTLGLAFDRHAARNELQAATFRLRSPKRIRLLLAASGALAIEVGSVPVSPALAQVAIVPLPVAASDYRLRHKTSDRGFYDAARAAAGTFEVLFEDSDGCLTEGSFTSLFVPRGDTLVTPPAGALLPGVLRAELLETGRAIQGRLTRADLTHGFRIGNALRGLIPAVVAVAK